MEFLATATIVTGGGCGPSKVLDFLATHQKELELDHEAEFTDNFRRLTSASRGPSSGLGNRIRGRSGSRGRIEPGRSPDELDHALATGQNHVRHGQKVYLLTRELREQATELQKRISGNPDALLLARASHRVEKFQAPSMEDFLLKPIPASTTRPMEKTERRPARSSALPPRAWTKPRIHPPALSKDRRGLAPSPLSQRTRRHPRRRDGTGKTVQALGSADRAAQRTRLCQDLPRGLPRHLLENWKREANDSVPIFRPRSPRTRPDRRILPLANPTSSTSYGTLVRDLELFEPIPFLCVIGDEAQHLKNRKTQNAQAMSSLSSDGRVLLTGTPIENSVSDLLSLLEFLLPEPDPSFLPPPAETNAFGTNNASSRKPPPTSCAAENGSRARTPRKDRTSSLPRPDGGTSRLLRRSPALRRNRTG